MISFIGSLGNQINLTKIKKNDRLEVEIKIPFFGHGSILFDVDYVSGVVLHGKNVVLNISQASAVEVFSLQIDEPDSTILINIETLKFDFRSY